MTKYPIPEEALQQNIITLGKTGSGKSSALRRIVEPMLDDGMPLCIIDPKGDWWGIKLSANGKKPGYPLVIFGGRHADVPINEHSGAHIAELFATGNRPCVIDLRGWMPGERTRFFTEFASTLFKLNVGRKWLLIDECHNFAPKGKVMDPSAGKMLHWANRLASEGRGLGITLMGASQRPQKVHNDFLTSCETLIAMRVLHASDRGAYKDWIDGCGDPAKGKQMLATIANLKRGTGYVWSPEIEFGPDLVKFPMFKTYDSFKPEEAGEANKLTGWAAADLEEVKAKLGAVVKEAEDNNPALLKKRIRELESTKKQSVDLESLRFEWFKKGKVKGYSEACEGFASTVTPILDSLSSLQREIEVTKGELRKALDFKSNTVMEPSSENPVSRMAAAPSEAARRSGQAGRGSTTRQIDDDGSTQQAIGAERRILKVLVSRNPAKLTMSQWATLCGMKKTGGTWGTYVSRLRKGGLIEVDSNKLIASTETALRMFGGAVTPSSPQETIEMWCKAVGGAGRMLRILVDSHPKSITRSELAEELNMTATGGTFGTYLSRLRSNGLIDHDKSNFRASDSLWK